MTRAPLTTRPTELRIVGEAAPGDLRGVADALGAALGVTVIVTDTQLDVVAHHVAGEVVHQEAQDWILRRTPPASARGQLPRPDLGGDGAVPVERLSGPRAARWSVVAVRTGGAVLGGLWALGPDDVLDDARCLAMLRIAAGRAADLLARHATDDDHGALAAHPLRAALNGRGPMSRVLREAGLPASAEVRLVALMPQPGQSTRRVEELVRLQVGGPTRAVAIARLGGRVYVLADPAGVDDVVAGGVTGGVRCAVSEPVGDDDELRRARTEVDRLLDLDGRPGVRWVGRCRGRLVVAEIAELAERHPGLSQGAVRELADLDAKRGTSYLPTLRAYFETRHDYRAAAARLYVHRNTLKYRLDRIRALTGLDLTDPVDELVADLQLRIHDLTGAAAAPQLKHA